jgi:hypothetical protein
MGKKEKLPSRVRRVARSAGVVTKPKHFRCGTTPRVIFDHAAPLTQEGSFPVSRSIANSNPVMGEQIV